jgi:hypothetical protein
MRQIDRELSCLSAVSAPVRRARVALCLIVKLYLRKAIALTVWAGGYSCVLKRSIHLPLAITVINFKRALSQRYLASKSEISRSVAIFQAPMRNTVTSSLR